MNRDRNGIYRFTEEEKALVKRRREESQKIKKQIELWYKGLCLFPVHIYRSKSADWGPYETRGKKASDCTIIKYGIYSTTNKAILDMLKADDETLKSFLSILKQRLTVTCYPANFRIKVVREKDIYGCITEHSYIQVIFIESNNKYQTVKGEPVSIIDIVKEEENFDLPW